MLKISDIIDIGVGVGGSMISANFRTAEWRYHFWVELDDAGVVRPTATTLFYKNPRDPSSSTLAIKMKLDSKSKAAVIAHVLKVINDGDVVTQALAAREDEVLQERHEQLVEQAKTTRDAFRRFVLEAQTLGKITISDGDHGRLLAAALDDESWRALRKAIAGSAY